jgi:hypothetical protein
MAFTYTDLVDNDHNMLIQSQWPGQQAEFINSWRPKGACLEQLVAHHLSLSPHRCRVASHEDWLSGSFNLCIPVDVERHPRVLVRLPFPHRFRSHTSPDMASEKIRNEAGTFAWLSKHCPNVPIPRLWAFGLSDGRSFRSLAQVSWARWLYEWLRRKLQQGLFDNNRWHPFAPSNCPIRLSTGYLIMDYIEPQQGSMLSTKWPSANQHHRRTLFRSLANILLDLIQVPLPRIGSFRALDNGEVTLSGRPLTAALASLEAQNIPSEIPPLKTYCSADTYIDDLLHCHDTRLRDQPNAVDGILDAKGQMATVVVLKALKSHFADRNLREGPFMLQLTDLHESNIFVDHQYNITSIVDLEWCCSLPIEMQQPQFWLSGQEGNDFLREADPRMEASFLATYRGFLEVLDSERIKRDSRSRLSFNPKRILEAAIEKKSHWYFAAVSNPRNAYSFLIDYIQPLFAPSHGEPTEAAIFQDTFAPYYTVGALDLALEKVKEKTFYDSELRALVDDQTTAL